MANGFTRRTAIGRKTRRHGISASPLSHVTFIIANWTSLHPPQRSLGSDFNRHSMLSTSLALMLAASFSHLLKRQGEKNWMHAVLGYVIPIVASLLLLPGRAELGLMTLQIVALGDGSATLGGMMLGGRRLPWNRKKTYSGLLCFAVMGSLAATYSYWGEANPGVPIGSAYLICGISALCAGIVESLPIRSNDNFRVGSTALLVGIVMSALVA